MKILLHMCCGPCTIYPLRVLREDGWDPMGFFYRHNIHPYTECVKRQETLESYADQNGFRLLVTDGYDIEGFLRTMAFREADRCRICYHERLTATAKMAKRGKFDAFSSTLLYSKFQQHDVIREIGEAAGKDAGVAFHYQDFRVGWQEGVVTSKEMGMYRQQYCGCIYSEKERYFRPA